MADTVINLATDKVLGPIMAALMDYTIRRIRYIKEYQKIAIDLKDAVKKLETQKADIVVDVQNKEIEEEEITKTAQDWLDKVKEMLENNELKALIKEADEIKNNTDDQCCSGCCHGSLDKRITFGKKASEKLEEINKLLPPPPAPLTAKVLGDRVKEKLEHLRSYKWDTREALKKNLIMKVLDGQVLDHVGLWGAPGVGKTTLVKEIKQEQQVQERFQKRVIVFMGESPNLKDIQNKIAEEIGVKLDDEDKNEKNAVVLENHIRNKKENILIILDNLWAKVDLNELGTGRNNEYCKHLIVTRSENVCKLMDIPKDNMLCMELMTDDEAIAFFWNVVYDKKSKNRMVDQITSYAYICLARKLILENCGGVPNVVAALANYLANLEIGEWKKLANELSKMSKEEREKKILHVPYEHSEKHEEEKQKFFSLGLVFQPETSIPIHEWMRYAIGLDLIKIVDSLSEAMSEADTCIHEMISMSLLEEEDKAFMGGLGHVTISRQARDRLKDTSFGSKIQLLDDIRRWYDLEKIRKENYNAISLWSGRNHGRICGKKFINLEVLILDRSYPQDQFEDDFFSGMTNLKVLVLKKMTFKKQLPMSLSSLNNLRLLHLEDCELGEDISLIGDLVNLVVLSFRKSKMIKFPANEIRRLSELLVLDLHECKIASNGIPANVLKTLANLEGFYGYGIDGSDWADLTQERNKDWKNFMSILNRKDKNASLDELNKLDQLNVLEIKVPHLHQLPENDKFVKKLQHFYIFVGKEDQEVEPISAKGFSRIMRFGFLESGLKANKYKCLQNLLAKTDLLSLEGMKITPFFVQQSETKLDTPEITIDVAEYTNLEVLKMYGCDGMKGFAAKPLRAPNLTEIEVIKCNKLNFLFIEHIKDIRDEYNSIPLLKKLVLKKLEKLGCISSPDITGNEAFAALFDGKVICPLLETLELVKCGQITQIWSNSSFETSSWTQRFKPSLKHLKEVSIKDCQKLQHVCSLAIAAALVKLKKLEIRSCSLLKTVIKADKEDYEDFTHNDNIKIFPALEELTLSECYNVKTFLSHKNSHGNQTFELPSLEKLRIQECPDMKIFSSIEIKRPKLWWLTVEPCTHSKKEIENINVFLENQNKEPRKLNEESSETDDVASNDLGKKSVGCANFTCFGDKLKEPNKKKRK